MTDEELDDLVDAWHAGEFSGQGLDEVVMEHTGWTAEEFCHWVSTGARPD